MPTNLALIGIIAGTILFSLLAIGFIFARLYRRSTKEVSFVRTGFGGQKVIMSGGTLVMPVLHETIPVNMNTLRLEVSRTKQDALITVDRIRVDVRAEFFVRVKPTEEAIADAAQTLGLKTVNPADLKELIEAKFVDALRAVAAGMKMEELHEKRTEFVQRVQQVVSEDILKNGLELEAVSLTSLDQTSQEFLNPKNAFDAQGLAQLTQIIESRRKQRNDIEQDTRLAIQRRNLEAEQESLQLSRQEEYAKLEQTREISVKRAAEAALAAAEQARRTQESRLIEIEAQQLTKQADITATRQIQEKEIENNKLLEIAQQEREISVAEKSRAQSEAQAAASKALALAVREEEAVATARAKEIAERQKAIELVEASKVAERTAIGVTVAATAEKQAALDRAEAVKTLAQADADRVRIAAEGESDAAKLRAAAAAGTYEVDAAGRRALNEAANLISPEIIALEIKKALIAALPDIIRESVKPMERIDGIKIVQVGGLGGGSSPDGAASPAAPAGGSSLADQVVQSALRYRAQAPLVDSLLKEVGLGSVGHLGNLSSSALGDGSHGNGHADDSGARKA